VAFFPEREAGMSMDLVSVDIAIDDRSPPVLSGRGRGKECSQSGYRSQHKQTRIEDKVSRNLPTTERLRRFHAVSCLLKNVSGMLTAF
jgi:hypothetical protein